MDKREHNRLANKVYNDGATRPCRPWERVAHGMGMSEAEFIGRNLHLHYMCGVQAYGWDHPTVPGCPPSQRGAAWPTRTEPFTLGEWEEHLASTTD